MVEKMFIETFCHTFVTRAEGTLLKLVELFVELFVELVETFLKLVELFERC